MSIVLYIYRSAIRCVKFSVAVFKASMLDWGVGGQSAMGICPLFYIYIDLPLDCKVWCSSIQGIYAQLQEGVGVNLP